MKIHFKKLKFDKSKITKPKIVMTISIFLVTILLVSVALIQFKTVEQVNETDLENLRESELREKISSWKSKYEETNEKLEEVNSKINDYKEQIDANSASSELLDNELLQSQILSGNTNVKGEGVVVTLTDGEESSITSSDLVELVNELRFGGAEAISINGIRITNMTDIVDISDRFILINPKQRLSSPYVVKAIGNQTYLVSTLSMKNTGFIDSHSNSGQNVKLEKQKNIDIPKYSWNMEIEYMKKAN